MVNNPRQSLRALDWLNFFMADINTGIGPFVAIYLTATRHWNPASVGVVVSAQSIASVAAALLPPTVAAISLGIVGKKKLSRRVGRNETFNHAGNVSFALVAGAIGTWIGQTWIFYMSSVVAFATTFAAIRIRSEDIDNTVARAATAGEASGGSPRIVSFRALLRNRFIWTFTVAVVLFHFANAAMLPLVGELLSKGKDGKSSIYMSACIVAAQFVMIPVAFLTGKLADPWGRKPLFLIGFGVLALRGLLYTLGKSAIYLLAVQSLDGVGAAIFGVLWVIIISDLAKGTGRFNLLQGVIQAALGLGAFLSNFLSGFVVKNFGYNVGFVGLASIAIAGMLFFALFMPETKTVQIPPLLSTAHETEVAPIKVVGNGRGG